MIQLQDLHEGSLLHNLHLRYLQKKIYTYTVCSLSPSLSVFLSLPLVHTDMSKSLQCLKVSCVAWLDVFFLSTSPSAFHYSLVIQGSILVAVNPYQYFDIYGIDMVKKYQNQLIGALPPHIFGVCFSRVAL